MSEWDATVNHPAHYTRGGYETIDFIERWFDNSYCAGQVVKYLSRAGHKGGPEKGQEDVRKALWYAERMAAREQDDWWLGDGNPRAFEADLDKFVAAKDLPVAIECAIHCTWYGMWSSVVAELYGLL